ncbi:hypothetical protein H4684_001233 [Desulfomicrobium macestii]|uniref:Uncharacterized protein n=1 Tax=Desulfomicrobium macestii TaxID=90731 RepID=A0ABR9H1M6_9BACT|nr:hypothetical protein [Desulfomicrobium macestii]MBE1424599.1 hypothetical protein [Desulfomicrobium macestii]
MFFSKGLIISLFLILSAPAYAQQHLQFVKTEYVCFTDGYLLHENGKWFVTSSAEDRQIPLLENTIIYGCDEEIFKIPIPSRFSGYPVTSISCDKNMSVEGGYYVREAQIPCN